MRSIKLYAFKVNKWKFPKLFWYFVFVLFLYKIWPFIKGHPPIKVPIQWQSSTNEVWWWNQKEVEMHHWPTFFICFSTVGISEIYPFIPPMKVIFYRSLFIFCKGCLPSKVSSIKGCLPLMAGFHLKAIYQRLSSIKICLPSRSKVVIHQSSS